MRHELQSAFNVRQYMLSKDFEIFYYNDLHLHSVSSHSHDYYEFYFFLEGNVDLEIGSATHSLRPGDLIVIPPGVYHRPLILNAEIPYRRFVFWISRDYCSKLSEESPDYLYLMQLVVTTQRYIWHFDTLRFNTMQSRVLSLLEEIHSERFARASRIRLCVNDLILHLNRVVYEQEHPAQTDRPDLYEALLSHIETHLSDDLSLDSIAGAFYISKFHIAHLFQQNTGLSLHQYIIKKRLSAARDAIISGTPIGEAVSLCGFQDYSTFYRAFKKQYGLSPAQYQELHSGS
ncbi:MAG: helix-turn-helix domain-containing protein [Lachnospiraceae bacterium]|nr:helix-turn-helix domain-containing protein [Lachnospiraceae bacterium]